MEHEHAHHGLPGGHFHSDRPIEHVLSFVEQELNAEVADGGALLQVRRVVSQKAQVGTTGNRVVGN